MANKKLVIIVLAPMIALLIILYLLSSTNLILKEVQEKIYQVSILVPDIKDSSWQNFYKGLDFAANELNVDLKKVTLFDWKDPTTEQKEQLKEEVTLGAQGVIICPLDYNNITDFIDKEQIKRPLVFCKMTQEGHLPEYSHVFYDFKGAGQALSDKIKKDINNQEFEIAIVTSREKNKVDESYIEGLVEGLGEEPTIKEHMISNTQEAEKLIKELGSTKTVIVGVDTESVELMANLVKENVLLYGIGFTGDSLNDLENGKIKAIACHDDYYAGYLSLILMAEEIDKEQQKFKSIEIPFKIVTKDNMFSPEIEKMIFPLG